MADNTHNVDYSLPQCNLRNLLEREAIRIPMIQRDYAQGRKNDTATDIRRKFVSTLVHSVQDGIPLELDFIYGSSKRNAFEPLDGQQRITTLFLLHWMLEADFISEGEEPKVRKSLLTYETRGTSADFCNELVKHSASLFRTEAEKKRKERETKIEGAEENLSKLKERRPESVDKQYQTELEDAEKSLKSAREVPLYSVSDAIKNRDWFNYLWQYDPTIQSMLVMIDAIWEEMDWTKDLARCRENLDKITFSNLNLGEFGLSDELFIKMNARGKQLSEFDIVKSTLEEEIQLQRKAGTCDDVIEAEWRSLIDGEWIDWFWNRYAANEIGEITESSDDYKKRLSLSKKAEDLLKTLIMRTITLRFMTTERLEYDLADISYDDKSERLDWVLSTYQESKRKVKKDPDTDRVVPGIDFKKIIENIKCLYFKDANGVYHDVFEVIPQNYNVDSDKPYLSYFSLFLGNSVSNDCKVVFYAIQRYLNLVGIQHDKTSFKVDWELDFKDWVHFCRNVFLNDNNNTRIDTPDKFIIALGGVDRLIVKLESFKNEHPDDYSTIGFIRTLTDSIVGVDNQSLAEEVEKATLVADPSWRVSLEKAESDKYLWGQIRCLVNWSEGDRTKFDAYAQKLIELLKLKDSSDTVNLIYAGILSISPTFGFSSSRFYQFNKHRDNSFKRYLREKESKETDSVYGPAIKALIDTWLMTNPTLPAEEFLKGCITEGIKKGFSYQWCILSNPDILNDATYKKVFPHNGHYVIAEKKTINSHCYDIALEYLHYRINNNPAFTEYSFYDSVGITFQHAITFKYNGDSVVIRQMPQGAYRMTINEADEYQFVDVKDMLSNVTNRFNLS